MRLFLAGAVLAAGSLGGLAGPVDVTVVSHGYDIPYFELSAR